jgi:two-component system, cell cycle response regulator
MKVLVAEDDQASRGLLERLLPKWGYGIVAVDSGSAAWSVLQSPDSPRLVLLDWMMPGMDGLEICRRVRSRPAQPYFYIILLTAHDKVANVVEGLESGADDYVTKPFHAEELKARLRVGLRMLELEQELVAAREALCFKASHDALTGVWNRGGIIEILERELQRAQREGSSLGIVLADFDYFKAINDTLGHLAGDEVLRHVVRRLSGAIRTYDSLGRYGGEEFLILLPGCDSTTLELSAERLKAAVSAVPIVTSAGAAKATISMGAIASADWKRCGTDELLRAADAALYRAKMAGRNRVEVVGSSDRSVVLSPGAAAPADRR